VVGARQRCKGLRLRKAGGSSKAEEHAGDKDMSIEDWGRARQGSGVQECIATAQEMLEMCQGGCKLYRGL
jgi:hypothetical protein